jgi:Ca2+-transporting ATPase
MADELDSSQLVGLSLEEAARRLLRDGPNVLPTQHERGVMQLMLEIAREPVFLLLLASGVVYLVLGDLHEALLLLAFVVVSVLLVISRQRKTERALAALRDLSSPRALVLRDGVSLRIAAREVVKGDFLLLEAGDRITADGKLIESHNLLIDESLLTGESVAVSKERGQAVLAGCMVVQGSGLAQVEATGAGSAIGKIGTSLSQVEQGSSPLQREIAVLIKRFAIGGVLLSVLVWLVYGWTRHDWLNGLLAGITLAMSLLPQEFSIILTVFMSLGAWRIARSGVLTRHAPVIEALGAATVLCVDKTGTLTQNSMRVVSIVSGNAGSLRAESELDKLSPAACSVVEAAALASEIRPFDPMEQAFHHCAARCLPDFANAHRGWQLAHEYALSKQSMAITHCWLAPGSDTAMVVLKGAPEVVLRVCRLTDQESAWQLDQVRQLAAQGLRVLAVARASHHGPWPAQADGFAFEWLGLVSLADPLRPGVPEAVAQCRRAGLRVIMITGDYPVTAQAIAQQAGLDASRIISGAQIDAASDTELRQWVDSVQIFARTLPQQKLRLVQALKAQREVVAMTGDGINDAPALKAAHIGISMGRRGTDVAREASSLVLLNDDFDALVAAVRMGRRIIDNLRKALRYVVGVHVPIGGMALLPLLTGAPMVITPALVMFLEMIINPASSIVFESEPGEPDLMLRPPRKHGEYLFGMRNIFYALLQGSGLLLACSAIFFTGIALDWSEETTRATVLMTMVLGNLAMIVASRSDHMPITTLILRPNAAQWWVVLATLPALFAVLTLPWLASAFELERPSLLQAAIAFSAVLLALCWIELVKWVFAHGSGRVVRTVP